MTEAGGTLSDHFKNLTIEYTTTGATTPLSQRTWTRVTGLTNGYQGTELSMATAVNRDGSANRVCEWDESDAVQPLQSA